MDIHPPEGPAHSFKDFVIHIAIVTVGILIALGLEGLREQIHERRLVRDSRENFRIEIAQDQSHMKLELENVAQTTANLNRLIADLPGLQHDPAQIRARVTGIEPSLYFFTSNSWTTALSSGALAHMSADEVSRYAGFDFVVHSYADMESRVLPQLLALNAYVGSRQTFGPQEIADTEEKLLQFRMYAQLMKHMGEQCTAAFDAAMPAN